MSTRRGLAFLFLGFAVSLPLTPQSQTPQAKATIRIYNDINIAAASTGAYADLAIPAGNWRIVSIIAYASQGFVVTTDVDTIITSNPEFQLRATESGAVETFISGGALRATATKKKAGIGAVFVRVIATLQQR
jgi:hypothetical protein